MPKRKPHVVWFKNVDRDDLPLVGGKGANLGEMTKAGFPVPEGFIVTSPAYFYFIKKNQLDQKIKSLMKGLNVHDSDRLREASRQVRRLINHSPVPGDLADKIMKAYLKLGSNTAVAVRSSATAEDLPDASFAGQQDTFLNVLGEANLVNKVRDAWSSLFTPRAIFYREQKKFDHFKVGIAVPVQRMVQSKVSGVMFTLNPVNNDKSVVVVEAVWGLGELIVQGSVTPDHYEVLKRTGEIVKKEIGAQTKMMVKQRRGSKAVNVVKPVPRVRRRQQKLKDKLIVEVANYGMKLQQHYFFPQDVEWAVEKDKVYIIQTRPVTTLDMAIVTKKLGAAATKDLESLVKGSPASPGLVSGPVRLVTSADKIVKVKKGEVLVTSMTTPDFVPAMKKAIAIVTDQGGQTSHAAIVSRELGLTCVVGTKQATKVLKNGMVVTVNGMTGEVFKGVIKQPKSEQLDDPGSSNINRSWIGKDLKTATKLYVNLAEPELAEKVAAERVDGVGLLRAEFMIAQIGVHPRKLIHDRKSKVFTGQLAEGMRQMAQAFYPRPVVYRATDFKTNEYRNLVGGSAYEAQEENPMIGYRGATRYLADQEVFELELEAIRQVRSESNNLHLMIPFVRSVGDLVEVKKLVYAAGLRRSSSFQLWMMVELPVNVISLSDFIEVGIDGVSIGSNDLTMLILGTDRDNQEISGNYNELNPAVLWAMEQTIKTANRAGVTSSICGQAPSLYPELTYQLVDWGITSISVSPDRIQATRQLIYEAEERLIKNVK